MINKKQLVLSTGIILALLGSNIIIGTQYISDSKEFQTEIKNKNEIIRSKQTEIQTKQQEFTNILKKNQDKIQVLTDEVNKTKNDLNQTQQENGRLTQQLKDSNHRKEVDAHRKINVIATAYTSSCNGCSGLTFTEYDVRNTIEYNGLRIIAADTSLLPLYSIVRIDTETESFNAIVIDTGGAIKDHKIDVLVNNYNEAVQFGKKNALITVLREGKGI